MDKLTQANGTKCKCRCRTPQSFDSCCGLLSPSHTSKVVGKLLFWYLTKYDLTDYHSSHQTRNDTHTHRNSVSNTRCIARPQWASSLNQKSIISLIWSPVIIGPNQTSVYHVDLINDDHNKRWLIYWLMIFSVNKNLFYDTDRWPSLTNWEDKNGFSGNHWNLCK